MKTKINKNVKTKWKIISNECLYIRQQVHNFPNFQRI